jgi:microsomal prostaglandin-E synthase 1
MDPNSNPVLHAYVATCVILGLNLLVLANNTALTRAFSNEVVNPEDTRLNSGALVVYDAGNDRTARYRRAHRNALENIPLFLVTGLLLPVVGVSLPVALGLYGVFVVSRVVHSVAYVRQLQPWRTASFAIGALTQIVLLVVVAWTALG